MRLNKLIVRNISPGGQADNKSHGEKAQIASDYLDNILVLTVYKDTDQIYMAETPVYVDMLSSTTIGSVGNKNVGTSYCGATKAGFTVC